MTFTQLIDQHPFLFFIMFCACCNTLVWIAYYLGPRK